MPLRRILIAVWVAGLTASVLAQAPANHLAFEVASVKQNKSGPTASSRATNLPPGDRVSFVNVTLFNLIQIAYPGMAEIANGPDWMARPGPPSGSWDRFDVTAKAESPASHDELQQMLRTLLAERFKLAFHITTKTEPLYRLTMARSDGRLGPKIHPAVRDCAAIRAEANGRPDPCGSMTLNGSGMTGRMSVHGLTMYNLGVILGLDTGRKIVDDTGLTGSFDWDLAFTPLRFLQGGFDRERFPTIDPDGPPLTTAIQEQLGLKLVAGQGDDNILVIDHVEHPTED